MPVLRAFTQGGAWLYRVYCVPLVRGFLQFITRRHGLLFFLELFPSHFKLKFLLLVYVSGTGLAALFLASGSLCCSASSSSCCFRKAIRASGLTHLVWSVLSVHAWKLCSVVVVDADADRLAQHDSVLVVDGI